MTKFDRKNKRRANKKREKFRNSLKNENNKLRAKYDEKLKSHLNRMKAWNDVRIHAMTAAKRKGYLSNNNNFNIQRDNTKYTSSKQMFAQIQQHQDNKNKKRQLLNEGIIEKSGIPPEKKRKIMSMMQ